MGKSIMDEVTSDFYVTLPSNSSMHYFKNNTQSSYRTKLVSPLMLHSNWEVALSEIFISRNWFNIDDHNKDYTLNIDTQQDFMTDKKTIIISFDIKENQNVMELFMEINNKIAINLSRVPSITFFPTQEGDAVGIEFSNGFELHVSKTDAPQLHHMLNLKEEDKVLKEWVVLPLRPPSEGQKESFMITSTSTILPTSTSKHSIPTTLFTNRDVFFTVPKSDFKKRGIFLDISRNIIMLELENYVEFTYDPIKTQLEIRVADFSELHITREKAESVLRILNSDVENLTVRGVETFTINPLTPFKTGETLELIINEYPKITKYYTETRHLSLNVGVYKSPESLFQEFQHVALMQLPNRKVTLEVPINSEVTFCKGLADMLGFVETKFKSGKYVSKYPLELDAGISELFVYTDIIESHYVGDSYAPLLRVIPCSNERDEQIVKHYDTPIYFPLRKYFVDTIQIEIKSAAGKNITFAGGKTLVLLSFRRKKSIN